MRLTILVAGLVLSMLGAAHALTPLPARADRAVYDAAAVIDAPTAARIEALDAELLAKAGVPIVIVTVPKLDGETIDQLAVRVQHDWGVGAKGKDESVVIALAVADRKIFIATGYGSEGYLPDGKVGEIRDRVHARLAANDFAGGLWEATNELATIAAAAHGVTLTGAAPVRAAAREPGVSWWTSVLATIAFLLGFGWLAWKTRGGGGRGGGGGGFLAGALLGTLFGGRGGGGGGDGGGGGGFGGFGGGSGGGGGAGGNF